MRFPPPPLPTSWLKLLAVAGLLLSAGPLSLQACIWIDGTTIEGLITRKDGAEFSGLSAPFGEYAMASVGMPKTSTGYAEALRATRHLKPVDFYDSYASAPVGRAGTAISQDPDWPAELDAAARPLFLGQPEEARQALETMNAARPGNYYILANLAVAEELCGRDRPALEKLEAALRLKPDAHSGTEWMHAAVLRAKIALAADPAWLETHTISGIPPDRLPAGFVIRNGAQTLGLKEIHDALLSHALARTLFVKPPDPVTAALLKELARVQARWWMVEGGLAVLDLADEYGARGTPALRAAWRGAITNPHRPPPPWLIRLRRPKVILALTAAGVGLISLVLLLRRRQLRRRRSC